MFKQRIQRVFHWHVMHKGESACHLLYLGATFIEGHGYHAMFAGGVAFFLVLGAVLAQMAGVGE
ncbi:hypothetical protein [Pseudomonas kilonensis]|uniref:hypothetical protein n=1 Tax=Pseudomonas kilonensis TaxID=132476 RepID=UPI0033935C53